MEKMEGFVPAFITNDYVNYYLIKNRVEVLFKEKNTIIDGYDKSIRSHVLYVKKENYDQVIDNVLFHLYVNNRQDDIYYCTKDIDTTVKCGYYRIGYSYSDRMLDDGELEFFRQTLSSNKMDININFNQDLGCYIIDVKCDKYQDEDIKFEEYITKYGIYPFDKIYVSNKYGQLKINEKEKEITYC